MKVYLAGPMTGIPQFNYPLFMDTAAGLRAVELSPEQGYGIEVVSPAELDFPEVQLASLLSPDGNLNTIETHGLTFGDFIARDVQLIIDDGIDAVVVLPGWETSRGARLETFVANAICGLPIMTWDGKESFYNVPKLDLWRAWLKEPRLCAYWED